MRHSKLGLRTLGLSVLSALSLMAFFAAGAQAQDLASPATNTAGVFLINLANALLATFSGLQAAAGTLLVPTKSLTIKCTHGHLLEGKFLSSTLALVKVLFLGCEPFVHPSGAALTKCIIPGKDITATAKLLPILHNANRYILAEPDAPALEDGTLFTTVEFEKEKGCALPLKNPVKGSVVAEVAAEGVTQKLTFSEAIQKLVGDLLNYGEADAFIIGSATGVLLGGHEGLKFGVL